MDRKSIWPVCVAAWHTPVPPNRFSVPVCYTENISQKLTFSKLFQRKREGDLGKQLKQIQVLPIFCQKGIIDCGAFYG
jgi:hypothetical protein